jgi:hypothetical protein
LRSVESRSRERLAASPPAAAIAGALLMDDSSIISSDTFDQTDEKILTYTVSDEALEAAAGAASRSRRG